MYYIVSSVEMILLIYIYEEDRVVVCAVRDGLSPYSLIQMKLSASSVPTVVCSH